MKIVIIGAGAMGCLYGAYLSRKNEVIMLDSYQPQVDAINENGITVLEEDGTKQHFPSVRACLSGEYKEDADLVIVFVKSTYTEDALKTNRKLFDDHTLVMTLQNGAGNDRKIEQYVARKNIIIGTSKHNSVNLGNGNVRHSGRGVTTIGSNLKENENLSVICTLLEEGGFAAEIAEDIQRIIWSKLFVNLSINTFTAITRSPIRSMIDNHYAWDFAEKMICEAVDVAEADGTHFSYMEVLNMVHHVCEDAGKGYSSMSQDVMNCRKTEIDAINGAIVEQAKLYNVAAPYNALVVDLIHAIEGSYKYQKENTEKKAEPKPAKRFEFRDIRPEETEEAIEIEQICFPPNEACSPKSMKERIEKAPELFLVAIDRENGKIAGFLNGVATDEPLFRDEFFTDITLHDANGKNVMLLGLDVRPEYRRQGLAREIVTQYLRREKEKGRSLLVLTCLDEKVAMYEKFGFKDLGYANSTWGGEAWHEMTHEV